MGIVLRIADDENEHAPFGHGYVRKITELITAKYPERDITYVNKGIGGDIVEGLEERWDADVIAEEPKWLSVKIGINNASRQHGAGVSSEEYLPVWEACYRRILTRAKTELDASLFLFEIFYIEEDVEAPRPLAVDAYNESIHRLAEAFDARLIPTNAAFDDAVAAPPRRTLDDPRWRSSKCGRAYLDGVGISQADRMVGCPWLIQRC